MSLNSKAHANSQPKLGLSYSRYYFLMVYWHHTFFSFLLLSRQMLMTKHLFREQVGYHCFSLICIVFIVIYLTYPSYGTENGKHRFFHTISCSDCQHQLISNVGPLPIEHWDNPFSLLHTFSSLALSFSGGKDKTMYCQHYW